MSNFTLKKSLLSLSVAVVLGMTGCSGGGSDSTPTSAVAKSYSGIGLDGILVGSTVCIDANTNNACDAGEPSAITDAQGKFTIAETTVTGPLLLVGGVDNSTGADFTGSLKAPAGSTVVTPLTSAIQSLVESGKSAEDAEANVKAAMGLTDVNLTTFDPYEEITGVNATKAQAVLAKQTQLQVLVHSATVTVANAGGQDVNSTMSAVFDAIVENFNGATTAVALDATKVTAATKKAADTVYATNPAARVAAKVVAQTSAENSVRDADSAEGAISGGTPAQATANLDAAITKVNTTAEADLKTAAENAKTAANLLTEQKIAEIEALQKAQQEKEAEILAAQQAKAEAETALVAAKATAEADAQNREKYEAYLVAQVAAEKAAKEKAQADLAAAQAQAAAAAEETAIAAEAAQREATAQAAAAQAAAEEAEAQARQDAADAAAAAAAQAADLAAAQAAAAQAQADAAAAIAQAQINTNVEMAKVYASKAAQDANATLIIATTYSEADANATTAQAAAIAAAQAAIDANITLPGDNNISASIAFKNEAQIQANIAAAALAGAQKIKSDAEIEVAAQSALEAKRARIAIIVSEVNTTKERAQTIYDANGNSVVMQIDSDMNIIETIAESYADAEDEFVEANSSSSIAHAAYLDAKLSHTAVNGAYIDVLYALNDANETAANEAKVTALAEDAKMRTALATLVSEAAKIAELRTTVEAIKTVADQTEAVAKAQRIGVMETTVREIATQANTTLSEATTEFTTASAQVATMYSIAVTYSSSEALTLANDANTTLETLLGHLNSLQGDVITVMEANGSMSVAVAEQDEAIATTALATATEANASIDALGATVEPLLVTVATKLAEAEAIRDSIVASRPGFVDGMVMANFGTNDGALEAWVTTLNGAPTGTASSLKYTLGIDGKFAEATPPVDYKLVNGVWTTQTNSGAYTIQTDGSAILENGEQMQIAQEVNLTTVPNSQNSAILDIVNGFVPGDTNVTFSSGAKAMMMAHKGPDKYELYWTPVNNESNATFSTILEAINDSYFAFGSYMDGMNEYHFTFEKDIINHVIDAQGTTISSLSEGMTGYLISTGTSSIVGTWSVVTLPGTSSLAIVMSTEIQTDNFSNLIAVNTNATNSPVMVGDFTPATSDFMPDSNPLKFNQIAYDDIKKAIEDAIAQSATFNLTTYLVGTTKYYVNGDGTPAQYTYDIDGSSLSGLDSFGAYSGESYSIVGNTYTAVTAEGTFVFTHTGTTQDGKGENFDIVQIAGGSYTGSTVLYANATDRDAIMYSMLGTPVDYGDGNLTGVTIYEVYFNQTTGTKNIDMFEFVSATTTNATGIEGENAGGAVTFTYSIANGNEMTLFTQNDNTNEGTTSFYTPVDTNVSYMMIGYWSSADTNESDVNYYFDTLEKAQSFSLDSNASSSASVLVDPYIIGATLCEDVNLNGTCEQGEQLSSDTNETGNFTFAQPLTPGSHIIIANQGKHEGKLYDLDLGAVVDAMGNVEVVSPMTTFLAKGLSTTQLAEILNKAAVDAGLTGWSITADLIDSNPLSQGVSTKSIATLNDSDFVALQASMASYGILKIMKGSTALSDLNASELYESGMRLNGHIELSEIAQKVLTGVIASLNKANLESVATQLTTAREAIAAGINSAISNQVQADAMALAGLPEPTADLVIKIAVVMVDRLTQIGYDACNDNGGSYEAALTAVDANYVTLSGKLAELGQKYYGLVQHDSIANLISQTGGLLSISAFPADIQYGYNAVESFATTIRFDINNDLVGNGE